MHCFLIIPLNVTSLPLLSMSLVRGRGFKAHHRAVLALLVNSRSCSDASSLEILDKLEAVEKVMMILVILRKYIINFIQMVSIHILEFHERHTTSVSMIYPMSWHLPSNLKTITSLQQVTIKFDYWSIHFFEHSKQMYTSFVLVTCHTWFDSGIFFLCISF